MESKLKLPEGLFNWLSMHNGAISFNNNWEHQDKHQKLRIRIDVFPRFMLGGFHYDFIVHGYEMEDQNRFNRHIYKCITKTDMAILQMEKC